MLDKTGGRSHMARHAAQLIDSHISVLAHIGLLPQKVASISCFRITGRTAEEAEQLAADASDMCDTSVFGIIIKAIIKPVVAFIAAKCPFPVIGVGASPAYDGQIPVTVGILVLYDVFTQKFVEKFADLQTDMTGATEAFHKAVVNETFPLKQHPFWPKQ